MDEISRNVSSTKVASYFRTHTVYKENLHILMGILKYVAICGHVFTCQGSVSAPLQSQKCMLWLCDKSLT